MKISVVKVYAVILSAFICLSAQAQLRVKVTSEKIESNGNTVDVMLMFDLTDLHMKSVESLIYTPVLVAGPNKVELPKLIIKSKLRYKLDVREEALSGTPLEAVSNYQVNLSTPVFAVEKFDRNNLNIPYAASVAYKSWMENATVQIREEAFGCCGSKGDVVEAGLSGARPSFSPHFRYLTPEKEPEKIRYEIGEAYLDFPQGQSVILPNFRNNRSELDKINQRIVLISNDRDVRVTGVEMRGYASPESSQQLNFDLSLKRARAMHEYFASKSNIPSDLFRTGIGGEDWEGLKTLIENKYYDLPNKWQILNIIETEPDLDRREQLIKNIGGGAPYQKIYKELYPKLRRVDCQVTYVVRNFTTEEGKRRIKEKPKMLSQNEMFEVARTYPEGSREFNETLITARKQFPDNDVANLNGAAAALTEGNVELAREYLSNVQTTTSPEYLNCLGVLYMYEGNFDEAEKYLKRAKDAGLTEANYNLTELAKLRSEQQQKARRRR